jgi:hypothetical protein
MKDIELFLWWSCGKLDSDGYEMNFSVSDEDYSTIVDLVKKFAVENDADDDWIDVKDFTEEYFCKYAPALYDKLNQEVKQCIFDTAIESADEWFDEEEEGCSVEEYLEDTYYFGFYFTENFVESVIKGL